MTDLTLGFSPCPNDTFIFDAMVNQPGFAPGLGFNYVMEDVETLNQWAFEGKLQITKLSYSAFLHLTDKYTLLDCGSALGRGVGPLLIQKKGQRKFNSHNELHDYLKNARIAIPGFNTTANLLFTLAFPEARDKTEVLFSEIENAVLSGHYDCGLVIHESRFTYQQKGLDQLIDMGAWWETESGAAIPLGGICIRKDIPDSIAKEVEEAIRKSLSQSWDTYPVLSGFVKSNAQEMQEEVMRRHIELYVNDFSTSLGTEGRKAISTLFDKAQNSGIITGPSPQIYLS